MSVLVFNIDKTWFNLTAAASLVADEIYDLQNISLNDIYLTTSAIVPAANARGLVLTALQYPYIMKQPAAETIYIRAAFGESAIAVLESAQVSSNQLLDNDGAGLTDNDGTALTDNVE